MPLLDYTTKVPVARTIGVIQGLLVEAGARQIGTEYDDVGSPSAIAFSIATFNGPRGFILPINVGSVQRVLEGQGLKPSQSSPEQSERVAWRIVKDWLEAQLAIIRTEMVTLEQVMLPYMRTDDGRTMFELYQAQQLALSAGDAS